jgi:hypothetical protein
LADIDSGRAKKLLKAFLGGRWRLNWFFIKGYSYV